MRLRFTRAARGVVIGVGAALVLPSCWLDFDGYRERPAGQAGAGASGGTGASGGSSGATNGGSGNAGGSGGVGGTAGASSGGAGGQGGTSGTGASGGVSGSGGVGGATGGTSGAGGSAGASGSGGATQCAPENPEPVCGANMNCVFASIGQPYDYNTSCVSSGTGKGPGTCSNANSSECAPGYVCTGVDCRRWCRLGGFNDCAHCGFSCSASFAPAPTSGGVEYGLCGGFSC